MKKKTLESIKDSFGKCYKELRFRNIDCRIKEDKIKNSFLVKLFNPDNFGNLPQLNEEQKLEEKGEDNLFAFFKDVEESKLEAQMEKQCAIM